MSKTTTIHRRLDGQWRGSWQLGLPDEPAQADVPRLVLELASWGVRQSVRAEMRGISDSLLLYGIHPDVPEDNGETLQPRP
jgi:hypothetical protein